MPTKRPIAEVLQVLVSYLLKYITYSLTSFAHPVLSLDKGAAIEWFVV